MSGRDRTGCGFSGCGPTLCWPRCACALSTRSPRSRRSTATKPALRRRRGRCCETGDFLHIRFQNEARNKKPAGIYWLQAAAVGAFSTAGATAIWPYRLPSLIGATRGGLLTFRPSARSPARQRPPGDAARTAMIARRCCWPARSGIVAEAHIAKTDAALLAAVVAGQGALGLAYVAQPRRPAGAAWIAAVFWLAQAAAILLKGHGRTGARPRRPSPRCRSPIAMPRWLRGICGRSPAGLALAADRGALALGDPVRH